MWLNLHFCLLGPPPPHYPHLLPHSEEGPLLEAVDTNRLSIQQQYLITETVA